MVIHPPNLYLGYVGFAVPFAFCIGALASGKLDTDWITSTRRWTLFAWFFNGVGILLGGAWAYKELGWGGYWAWDPVENASLMPWLVGTAFLHSVMIQEKRGMLKVWNVSLIIITYALTIFGTFLTRSGVISSVHAFANSSFGWAFLVYLLGGARRLLRPDDMASAPASKRARDGELLLARGELSAQQRRARRHHVRRFLGDDFPGRLRSREGGQGHRGTAVLQSGERADRSFADPALRRGASVSRGAGPRGNR